MIEYLASRETVLSVPMSSYEDFSLLVNDDRDLFGVGR